MQRRIPSLLLVLSLGVPYLTWGAERDTRLGEATRSAIEVQSPESVQRLFSQPEVQAVVGKEIARQISAGTYYDERALRSTISMTLSIDEEDLPPLRLMADARTPDLTQVVQRAHRNLESSRNGTIEAFPTSTWEKSLQDEAMRPEVQAVIQKAIFDHLDGGGTLDVIEMDKVLAGVIPDLPRGQLREVLEQAMSAQQQLPQGQMTASVANTLERLSPADRDLLADHLDILANHGRLVDEIQSWPPDQRRAAQKFISYSRRGAIPTELGPSEEYLQAARNRIQFAREQGYWDRSGTSSALQNYLGMVQSRSSPAYSEERGRLEQQDYLSTVPVFDELQFSQRTLEEYLDPSQGEIRLKKVPSSVLTSESEAYVIPTTHGAIRIYTHTAFGGTMLLKEERTEEVIPILSTGEHSIAGNEAFVSLSRYDGDRWETHALAYDGWMSYQVEVEGKLEGIELERFIEFTRDFVENG